MRAWGFVFLAYGVAWSAILVYRLLLWKKRRKIEAELSLFKSGTPRNPSEDRI